jgi:hypothetical protein
MRPVLVARLLELAQGVQRMPLFQIKVRSSSSRRQVCTQRSTIAFILGSWTPLSTVSMLASARMAPDRPGNLPPRSRIMNRARLPASSRSMTRFLAAWTTLG